MFLSLVGIFKNNFVLETYLANPANFDITTLFNIDSNIALTQFLIGEMAMVSKGVLAVSSFVAFISNFFNSNSFLPQTDVVPFIWNLFIFTVTFWGATFGLMQKYGVQSMITGNPPYTGLLQNLVVNYIPDIFVGILPLYLTFIRLD